MHGFANFRRRGTLRIVAMVMNGERVHLVAMDTVVKGISELVAIGRLIFQFDGRDFDGIFRYDIVGRVFALEQKVYTILLGFL